MPDILAKRLARGCGLLLMVCASACLAGAEDPDPSFGVGGRVTVDTAPEPDGHDYLFQFGPRAGGGYVALVARRDPSFGTPALVQRYDAVGVFEGETRLPASHYDIRASALMPDGRIVYAEPDAAEDGHRTVIVHRRLPDGSADPLFGGGSGQVLLDENNIDLWPTALTVDAAGRIIVAGSTVPFGVPSGDADDSFIIALAANGGRDGSVGFNGFVYFYLSVDRADVINDVLRDRDGRVYICGSTVRDGSEDAVLVRLTAAGAPDATFGSGGSVFVDTSTEVPPTSASDACRRLAMHPGNGRMHFAMRRGTGNPSTYTLRVQALGESGSLSINPVDALASVDYASSRIGFAFDDERRPLLATAARTAGGQVNAAVARLRSTSQLDASFSGDGETRYSFTHAGALRTASDIGALFADGGRIVLGANYRGDQPGFDPILWSVLRLQGSRIFDDGLE